MIKTKVSTQKTFIPDGYKPNGYNDWAEKVLKQCGKKKNDFIAVDLGLLPREKLRN